MTLKSQSVISTALDQYAACGVPKLSRCSLMQITNLASHS